MASPAASQAIKSPGRRPGFSRNQIVGCALRLVEREGAAALSFRAVARELDITAGTLARYFPNLADLQDAVAAAIWSEVKPLKSGSTRALRDQLLRSAMSLMDATRKHPYLVSIQGPASAAALARLSATGVKVLLQAGIGLERAAAIYSMVMQLAYVWGTEHAVSRSPETNARIAAAGAAAYRDVLPEMLTLPPDTRESQRQRMLMCIDGLLR
jgi:AcrR family transcriptional regulator